MIIKAGDSIFRNHWEEKQDPIQLCTKLTAKLLKTAYKLKILKSKLDEDPLQHRVYFLTFVESLEMIFSYYKETCEVVLYNSTIGGGGIKYYVKKAIRNLLHANFYFRSKRLIAEFPRWSKIYFKTSTTL